MIRSIVVPVEVDAIWSTGDSANDGKVVDTPIDFGRLPRRGRGRDIHPGRAPIGEEVVLPPLQNAGVQLGAGVHLHWRLPASLTQVSHLRVESGDVAGSSGLVLAAPNRWLVTRQMGEARQRWIVESDHLHDDAASGVPYPTTSQAGEVEIRSLGRVVPFEDWNPVSDGEAEYLPRLTAFGSGEPTFASYYPSCRTVFGFHDHLVTPTGINPTYTVVGWYRRSDQDPIAAVLAHLDVGDDPNEAIEQHLAWSAALPPEARSAHTFCFGRVDVPSSRRPRPTVTHVAIGHSGPEAAAALLASSTPEGAKRDVVEKQIEAALLEDELNDKMLDATSRYHAARHRRGFVALPGEPRWEVRVEADPARSSDAEAVHATQHVAIPDRLSYGIGLLNDAERQLARAVARHDSLRRRLFDDWYRYMVASYPAEGAGSDTIDADRVRHFVERRSLIDLDRQARVVDSATRRRDDQHRVLSALLDTHNDAVSASTDADPSGERKLTLQSVQAPRYWSPREPVVVIGIDAPPSTSHLAADAAVDCAVVSVNDGTPLIGMLDAIHADRLSAATPQNAADAPPMFLEWRVDFRPDVLDTIDATDTYLLGPDPEMDPRQTEPDLYRRSTSPDSETKHPHAGRSIVGTFAGRHLSNQIVDRLVGTVERFLDQHPTRALVDPSGDPKADARRLLSDPDRLGQFTDWFDLYWQARDRDEQQHESSLRTLVDGLETLAGLTTISQVLDGFNAGLLAHRQSYQLPIMDPLAFDEYDDLVGRVTTAVGDHTSYAPLPDAAFSPLRGGSLALSELRLIDSFGLVTDVPLGKDDTTLVVAESMRARDRSEAALTPRLLQPARLHLRWLSANHDDHDAHGTGPTAPICGWVLPNELDETLVVYGADGVALGTVGSDGMWRPSPGRSTNSRVESIENPHLRRVIAWIVKHRAFSSMREAIIGASEQIEPEASAQHQALSLLMGRPIAVVRAEVGLEMRGAPADDPSWESFRRQVMHGDAPSTGRIDELRFPVRIGDHHQVNDGVIGYWREGDSGEIVDDAFHTARSRNTPINLSLDSDPERITLLLDPRGSAHATCGILPTKSIAIPHEQFDDALRHLGVTFEISSLLMPGGSIQLPLPTEPGHAWSFVERRIDGWMKTPESQIDRPGSAPAFVRSQQVRDGWLRLEPSGDQGGDVS